MMNVFARAVSALLFFVLTDVAAAETWHEARGRAWACLEAVDKDPALAPTRSKLVQHSPTLSQLADDNVPTAEEAAAVEKGANAVRPCRALMREAILNHHPAILIAQDVWYLQIDMVYIQLIKRQITYGNANRLFHEAYLQFMDRWVKYAEGRLEAEQRQMQEERRQMAEAIEGIGRAARVPPPVIPGTTRMNCVWMGSVLQCTPTY